MPLPIGKMTVNVSLCGAIPRSDMPSSPAPSLFSDNSSGAQPLREKLSCLTSSAHNKISEPGSKYSCLAVVGCSKGQKDDRSTRDSLSFVTSDRPFSSLLSATVSQSEDSDDTTMLSSDSSQARLQPVTMVEPPRWAVPAKGESRFEVSFSLSTHMPTFSNCAMFLTSFPPPISLQPVCEALGTHSAVDLTSRSCFRIGRSPSSDVQLFHGTSSRRHALLFHHPNGSCYVVDCGSAHGTYVNGVRVRSTPSAGMVIPHLVRRGALVRFGGPGAPSFVLKTFSVGFSHMVKDLDSADSFEQVQVNTRINALGSSVHCGILKKRSLDYSSEEDRSAKRRCVSPPTQCPESSPLRLVSPDPSARRVTFNDVPIEEHPSLVSPDLSSDDASLE